MSGDVSSTVSADVRAKTDVKPRTLKINFKPDPLASGSSGTLTPINGTSPPKAELIELDDGDDDQNDEAKPYDNKVKVEEHRKLYAAEEKKLKDQEPPPAARLQDDWQVAYVWAFIVKFNQKEKIRSLESLADFERCLTEPVAVRPDDVLEGILIQFLKNLKPTLRNLSAETIQGSLSNYISDQLLNSAEFTVWDRPWASNEEVRGGCCNDASNRTELGRLRYYGEPVHDRVDKNPIKRVMEQGGGIFELDWRERAKMLRQLVDWQLTHADVIRTTINKEFKVPGVSAKKDAKQPDLVPWSVKLEPLGQDRNKNRIWSIDSSTRLYRSGNPFKRPCPLVAFAHTRAEFDATVEGYEAFSAESTSKPEGKGAKGKMTAAQANQYKRALKSKEDEKKLAEELRELIPGIEKEEQRVQRAKKRVAAAAELAQMAEWRSTRTRRTTRKVDYAYDGVGDDDGDAYEEEAPSTSKRRRGEPEFANGLDNRGRPIIPGERRSARMNAQEPPEEDFGSDSAAPSEEIGFQIGVVGPDINQANGDGTENGLNGDGSEGDRSDDAISVD